MSTKHTQTRLKVDGFLILTDESTPAIIATVSHDEQGLNRGCETSAANAQRLALAWNCHDDAISIAKHLVAIRQPCGRCEESGVEPGNPKDACHACGGLGEHCDAAEVLAEARAVLAKVKGEK